MYKTEEIGKFNVIHIEKDIDEFSKSIKLSGEIDKIIRMNKFIALKFNQINNVPKYTIALMIGTTAAKLQQINGVMAIIEPDKKVREMLDAFKVKSMVTIFETTEELEKQENIY